MSANGGCSNGACSQVYKHRREVNISKENGEHQNKTERCLCDMSDTHPCFPFSRMGGWLTFHCIFVLNFLMIYGVTASWVGALCNRNLVLCVSTQWNRRTLYS